MSAQQVGWVIFSEVIAYENVEQFEADCLRHGVQHDTAYSWVPGKAHHLVQKNSAAWFLSHMLVMPSRGCLDTGIEAPHTVQCIPGSTRLANRQLLVRTCRLAAGHTKVRYGWLVSQAQAVDWTKPLPPMQRILRSLYQIERPLEE